MAALSVRESVRYGVRLFGYLLATTILGGGLLAGGVVLSTRVDVLGTLSGTGNASYALVAAAVGLSALGVLVFATGLFVVGFVAVADAVRVGVERSSPGPSAVGSLEPEATESRSDGTTSDDQSDAESNDAQSDPLGGDTDPFDERDDPFDEPETEDPLGRTNDQPQNPQHETSRQQAGPARSGDDEAWRREIEAKLDEEEQSSPRE